MRSGESSLVTELGLLCKLVNNLDQAQSGLLLQLFRFLFTRQLFIFPPKVMWLEATLA